MSKLQLTRKNTSKTPKNKNRVGDESAENQTTPLANIRVVETKRLPSPSR